MISYMPIEFANTCVTTQVSPRLERPTRVPVAAEFVSFSRGCVDLVTPALANNSTKAPCGTHAIVCVTSSRRGPRGSSGRDRPAGHCRDARIRRPRDRRRDSGRCRRAGPRGHGYVCPAGLRTIGQLLCSALANRPARAAGTGAEREDLSRREGRVVAVDMVLLGAAATGPAPVAGTAATAATMPSRELL